MDVNLQRLTLLFYFFPKLSTTRKFPWWHVSMVIIQRMVSDSRHWSSGCIHKEKFQQWRLQERAKFKAWTTITTIFVFQWNCLIYFLIKWIQIIINFWPWLNFCALFESFFHCRLFWDKCKLNFSRARFFSQKKAKSYAVQIKNQNYDHYLQAELIIFLRIFPCNV